MKSKKILIIAIIVMICSCSKNEEPSTLSISSNNKIVFSPSVNSSEHKTIYVSTNQATWSVESDQSWCKVIAYENYFIVSAEQNTKEEPPSPAIISVMAGDAKPIKILATQEGVLLDIKPKEEQIFNDDGGSFEVSISCNRAWTIINNESWISLERDNGSGYATVNIIISPNSTPIISSADIVVKAGNITQLIRVKRDMKREKYQIGDLYPKNGTPIGMVFDISNEGRSGKIFNLNHMTEHWSAEFVRLYADRWDDGLINTETVKAYRPTFFQYSTFYYFSNITTGGLRWYFPAVNEVKGMYSVWNGGKGSANQIARNECDRRIVEAGGVAMSTGGYSTSTEYDATRVRYVLFSTGLEYTEKPYGSTEQNLLTKNVSTRVRAVATF